MLQLQQSQRFVKERPTDRRNTGADASLMGTGHLVGLLYYFSTFEYFPTLRQTFWVDESLIIQF
jgi:hypothetical protein